jgi:hypothetical protein
LKQGRCQPKGDDEQADVNPGCDHDRSEPWPEDIEHQQRAQHRRGADHNPEGDPGHMHRRITGAVNYSLRGVKQFEAIQVKPPSPTGDQDAKQDGEMGSGLRAPGLHLFSTAAELR